MDLNLFGGIYQEQKYLGSFRNSLETHIFNFSEEIYGNELTVDSLHLLDQNKNLLILMN